MRSADVLRCLARPPWTRAFPVSLAGLALGVIAMPAVMAGMPMGSHPSPGPTAFGQWILMLLAMMPPFVAPPLQHVAASSLRSRRWRAAAWFLLGYGGVWSLAGVPLLALSHVLQAIAGARAAWLALAFAVVWTVSPGQQVALNRCHRLSRIGALGWSADCDCLRFGVQHARWCLASCWAWMLVPLLSGSLHLPVMVAIGTIMFLQRVGRPREPRWRIRCPVLSTRHTALARTG